MAFSPSIALESKDYSGFADYDRFYTLAPVEEHARIAQTLVGSGSSLRVYTRALVDLFGFAETSSISTLPVDLVVARPTDEELWLSLVGIFASGDPNFAKDRKSVV